MSYTHVKKLYSRGGGGEDLDIKKVGVFVVSLRGVNFRFWSRLGCSQVAQAQDVNKLFNSDIVM